MTILAYDRTGSVRSFDDNGRLRVERTPISKANICTYRGREIPHHAQLGLNPDQQYRLLRDPHELEKAAESFNSLPVLEEHIPTSAETHPRELTVGATMDNARFEKPYLTIGMVIFDGPAIRRIQSGQQKELSCGYAYDADMTPGQYENQPYDGRMTNIRGNHIALVTRGRAGPDVLVHDASDKDTPLIPPAQTTPLPDKRTLPTMKKISDITKVHIPSGPEHLHDNPQKTDNKTHMETALSAMEAEMKKEGFTPEQAEYCRMLCARHLGMMTDSSTTLPLLKTPEDLPAEDKDNHTESKTESEKPHNKAENRDSPAGTAPTKAEKTHDTAAGEKTPSPRPEDDREAALNIAIQKALSADRALRRATEDARRLVRPLVGDVHGMDSADEVYRYALQHSGMAADSLSGINQAGLRALVHTRLHSLAPTAPAQPASPLAHDSATSSYTTPRRY